MEILYFIYKVLRPYDDKFKIYGFNSGGRHRFELSKAYFILSPTRWISKMPIQRVSA